MRVLVVNAGSSSLKLRLLDGADMLEQSADLPAGEAGFDTDALATILNSWPAPDVVGHRIVHGGADFTTPVAIDATVERQLRALTDLAPLHQPKSLAGLDAVSALLPEVAAVACFDTAFHASLPAAASTYAIPLLWRQQYGIRRYGFHGLSHAYASRRAAELIGLHGAPQKSRMVTCHLGAGASLAAVLDGRSVDTSMGFTPLEGLVMATRSGSVDPGALLWLQEHEHVAPQEIAAALEHSSGLLALAGTAEMPAVLAGAARLEAGPQLALDVYLHRLAAGIAAMTAALGGLDALVFTGGVGERSPTIRQRTVATLGYLGLGIDTLANSSADRDAEVTSLHATARTFVIAAREDLEIARESRSVLAPIGR